MIQYLLLLIVPGTSTRTELTSKLLFMLFQKISICLLVRRGQTTKGATHYLRAINHTLVALPTLVFFLKLRPGRVTKLH